MGRCHWHATRTEDQTLQQSGALSAAAGCPLARTLHLDAVDLVPKRSVDDGLMFAWMGCALKHGVADVDAVVQELVDRAFVDQFAATIAAFSAANLICPR